MKSVTILILTLLIFTGCSSWGGYIHESEKFKFKYTFPEGWEVWDKSDDRRDFLLATYKGNPEIKIEVIATPVAPDMETSELYPFFLEGSGDAGALLEFNIEDKGLISASNREGRFIKVHWKGEKTYMRGFRALFLGVRFKMEIRAEMHEDLMSEHEAELARMIREIKL